MQNENENKEQRNTYSFSMRPNSDKMLTEIAEKMNQSKSRMVETLIMREHSKLFKTDIFE